MIFRRLLIALTAASLALPLPASAQQGYILDYPSIHTPAIGDRGMVVTQSAPASQIGAEVLRQGGNAIDAAVAVGFALAVTLPRAGNLGGGGFMTLYRQDLNSVGVIDFRSVAPQAATLDMFVDEKGKERPEAGLGYRSPAVPGTVAGLYAAHRKHGRLPWATLVEPAIRLARDGVALTHDEAYALHWARARLSASQTALRTYYRADGGSYAAGERITYPDLAWALEEIARDGADAFYRGEIGRRIAADMQKHGGLITLEDLAAYRPVERTPLVGTYRGHTIYTTPPASAGGATLLNMLNILEHFDLASLGAGSAESLHLLAETMKLGAADRYKLLGDTDFVSAPVQGFISKGYGAERAKLISPQKSLPAKSLKAGDPLQYESPQTTHYSVADAQGNVVSVTYTLGASFGSGVVAEGTGILLNNQMNNFSHEAAWEHRKNGGKPPLNGLEPGKRMLSTMSPTLVFRDGRPWLITGTPGGSTIINTILQVIVNTIDFKMNIADATHQPRIYQGTSGGLHVESYFNPDTVAILKAKGHRVRTRETMGSAQSIMIEEGRYLGAADPRRPGALAVAP